MSDSIKYYFDEDLNKKEEVEQTEKVLDILALFKELSVEEKFEVRKLINKEKIL